MSILKMRATNCCHFVQICPVFNLIDFTNESPIFHIFSLTLYLVKHIWSWDGSNKLGFHLLYEGWRVLVEFLTSGLCLPWSCFSSGVETEIETESRRLNGNTTPVTKLRVLQYDYCGKINSQQRYCFNIYRTFENKFFFNSVPTSWLIFLPPSSTSPLTRALFRSALRLWPLPPFPRRARPPAWMITGH